MAFLPPRHASFTMKRLFFPLLPIAASLFPMSLRAGELVLDHDTAEIHGKADRELENDCIGSWEDERTTVRWSIRVDKPGKVTVECLQAAEARSAGNGYDIVIDGRKVEGTVKDTGSWQRFENVEAGTIELSKRGNYDVKVVPRPKNTLAVMNLRGLRLKGEAFTAVENVAASRRKGAYFAKKTYTPEPLPEFAASKRLLPEPVIDGEPGYLEMYWKSWELAFKHIRKAEPEKNGFVSNYLDEAFNPNIFQWDTIFMVMFARYGHQAFPAVQSFDNFYCKQHADGFICREIWETTGKDHHSTTSPQAINPPLFSWGEMESFRVTGDKSRFALVLPVLEKYVEWLETGRRKTDTAHGLYWSNGLGSGMDNTPRQGSGWVDMSSQMVLQYHDLAAMCRELGQDAKAVKFDKRAAEIAALINRWMWDEKDGLYYDIDDQGKPVKWKTSGCFWPMLAGITLPAQEARLIANLKDPQTFWRKNVFPTLAADQPGYDGSGGYWRGGVWAPTNYAILRGLARQGHGDFAREAAKRHLDEIQAVFRDTGTLWELYAPDMQRMGTGPEGLKDHHGAKPDFVGWTGCGPISMLIENILGFEVNGARQSLAWELTRTDRHGIRNLRFGPVEASLVCEPRKSAEEPARIQIVTNRPFTLQLDRNGMKKEVKVKSGASVVEL